MSKINILIVEDEAIVAKDIQQSLRKSGYNVLDVVSSGAAAIKSLELNKPDLVILDVMLKGDLSGVDVSEFIKREFNIPVIFLTAYADQSTLDKAKLTEPYGYIIKPFREIELYTTIEMALFKHKSYIQTVNERDLLHSIIVETSENNSQNDFHFIKSNSRYIKLASNDIWYIEALKDYVSVNTENHKYTIHSTMKEIESKLPSRDFIRVHRSFIVRISKIVSMDVQILRNANHAVPIPSKLCGLVIGKLM